MNRLKHTHLETPRTSKKEPLAEVLVGKPFTVEELQVIISQRPLLISQNLRDEIISKELSKELDRSALSIYSKIRKLVKSGQLPENPNKRECEVFTEQELQITISQRALLVAKKLTDQEISRELSKLIDRSDKSNYEKIRQLLKSGQLPENPNKMKDFDEEELQVIISQRPELITKNITDGKISRELSKQLNRSAGGIKDKIRNLVKSGELTENPNKKENEVFTNQELQTIISQRPELIAKDLTDNQISKELSKQLNRSAGGIKEKIRRLVRSGHLSENPNRREREGFTDQELQTITSQRSLLITKKLTDREISRELSKQLDRSAYSTSAKIRKLVKSGRLSENPNKMKGFAEEELQIIISQRPELITKNITDKEISIELSKLLDRSARSIDSKIRQLVKSGQLPENPNKRGGKFSDDELLGQLTDAVDIYTGEKNE